MQIYCPTSTYIGDYNYTGSIVCTLYFGPSRRSLVCSWLTNCSVTSEDIWDREKYGCWSNRKGSVLRFWASWFSGHGQKLSWPSWCPDFRTRTKADKSCLDPRGVLISGHEQKLTKAVLTLAVSWFSGHRQKLSWPSWFPDFQDTDKSCIDPRGVLIFRTRTKAVLTLVVSWFRWFRGTWQNVVAHSVQL